MKDCLTYDQHHQTARPWHTMLYIYSRQTYARSLSNITLFWHRRRPRLPGGC